MTATATHPPVVYQLADLLAPIASKAADAGADAAITVGDPACQYHLGRLSMAREIAELIERRIAGLTGGES